MEAQDLIMDNAANIFMYSCKIFMVQRDYVKNFEFASGGQDGGKNYFEVWLEK